jgi:hypothetical protein
MARSDCPRTTDSALLERAEAEARLVLTLDKDFWQIAAQRRIPLKRAGLILFRVHPAVPEKITPIVKRALEEGADWQGRIIVVRARGIHLIWSSGRP